MARLKYQILFILYQIVGDVVGMSCYWFCDETSQFELDNYFYSSFFHENYHILALRMRGISVTWPH